MLGVTFHCKPSYHVYRIVNIRSFLTLEHSSQEQSQEVIVLQSLEDSMERNKMNSAAGVSDE